MPVITYDGSKLTKEQKAEIIKQFSETGRSVTGINKESFVVIIRENDPDNIGVGGLLLSERLKG